MQCLANPFCARQPRRPVDNGDKKMGVDQFATTGKEGCSGGYGTFRIPEDLTIR